MVLYFLFKPVDYSDPDPIAIYPLNGEYETREMQNRQPQGIAKSVSLADGPDGKPNGSYQFYGNNTSYIEFPNNGSLGVQHSITMLCWVFFSQNTKGPLFTYDNNTIGMYILKNMLFARFFGIYQLHEELSTNLVPNQWHYIVASFDHATNNASLWVNGTKREQKTIFTSMTPTAAYDVRMGSDWTGKHHFEGRIAVMQVYNFS